jgi:hypothetical protein
LLEQGAIPIKIVFIKTVVLLNSQGVSWKGHKRRLAAERDKPTPDGDWFQPKHKINHQARYRYPAFVNHYFNQTSRIEKN